MSRALSAAASGLLEIVARLALLALLVVALAVRLMLLAAMRAAGPTAARNLHTAALGRLPPSA